MAPWNLTLPALETYLDVFVPASAFPVIVRQACSVSAAETCYTEPSVVNHLSSQTWLGTLRLLFLCAAVQAAVMVVAFLWDSAAKVAKGQAPAVMLVRGQDKYFWYQGAFDVVVLIMNLLVCATFAVRSYATDAYPMRDATRAAMDWIDLVGAGIFLAGYLVNGWNKTPKLAYTVSIGAVLDVLSIVSAVAVAIDPGLWLPFTFLRPITMSMTLYRIVAVIDLPEITEQLAVSIVDFFSMVFTFAGIFFMLENLGNLPVQTPAEDRYMNFSLFDSIWFVLVSVSTVGYGDISPKSILGQFTAGVMILIGVIFFGSKTAEISAIYRQAKEGHGRYSSNGRGKHAQHIVVTGDVSHISLRDFAAEYFHKDHAHEAGYGHRMCVLGRRLIDTKALIRQGLVPVDKVQSLCGALPRDQHRIRPEQARAFFFLPTNRSARSAVEEDRDVLLRALSAKRVAPTADVFLGLHLSDCLHLASDATALCVTGLMTGLLAKSCMCPGIIPLVANLAYSGDKKQLAQHKQSLPSEYLDGLEQEVYRVNVPREYINKKYGEIVHHVMTYKDSGILIFGVGSPDHAAEPHGPSAGGAGGAWRGGHGGGKTKFVLYPGKDHDITEPYMFCIARENPQRLVDQSVPSYTYKRNVYAQRRKFKTGLKIAHVYKGARGGSQSGVSSAAVSVAGGNMGVEHAETHTADASDVANPPRDGASLGPEADPWPAGTGQAARRSGGDGGGKQRSKRRKTIKPLPGLGAFVQGPPGASDGGVLHPGTDAGSPTAAAATAQGKPAPGPAAHAGQAAGLGAGAKRWKAVAGSGAMLEAPEPVADVPETLDHTHRQGESQWAKATSAVVGLVQEGQADLTMMAPLMEPIADDPRALAGQVADGQEVPTLAPNHVLVARARTHRQTDRQTRARAHTQVVTLRNHILVAGFPVSIRSFMMAVTGICYHTRPVMSLPMPAVRRVSTKTCGPQVRNSEAVAHALRDTKGPPSQPHSAASGAAPCAYMYMAPCAELYARLHPFACVRVGGFPAHGR